MIVTIAAECKLIPTSYRDKTQTYVVYCHDSKAVVMPVDYKLSSETSKDFYEDADSEQGYTWRVLDQNVIVRSKGPPERE